MTIDEIAKDILKKEDNELARAFTMVIGSLLLSKGIHPIINKSIEEWNENDDLNKYIIRKEYNVTFDIDTTEHDANVRSDAIDEFANALCSRCSLFRDYRDSEYEFDWKQIKAIPMDVIREEEKRMKERRI